MPKGTKLNDFEDYDELPVQIQQNRNSSQYSTKSNSIGSSRDQSQVHELSKLSIGNSRSSIASSTTSSDSFSLGSYQVRTTFIRDILIPVLLKG